VHLRDAADDAAADLRTVVVHAHDWADGAWVAVEFAPLSASAGRPLYVWMESDVRDAADAVMLWTYVAGWGDPVGSGLRLDHVDAPGSLTFRTFHARAANTRTGCATGAEPTRRGA
jgi:hypothetical protein